MSKCFEDCKPDWSAIQRFFLTRLMVKMQMFFLVDIEFVVE